MSAMPPVEVKQEKAAKAPAAAKTAAEGAAPALPMLAIRPQGDFRVLDRPRPGGSSADVQFFQDASNVVWVGKCGMQAMSKDVYRTADRSAYYDEYREWLGLMLYRLFGVPTPDACLSPQRPRPFQRTSPTEEVPEEFDYARPCIHIMTRFVDGFATCGDHFLANYQRAVAARQPMTVAHATVGQVPVQGFGAVLAVACFIYDLDCLGRSGGNMGYTFVPDSGTGHQIGQWLARIIKIDPGYAFSFLDQGTTHHDPRRQRDIHFATGNCLIRYDQLNAADQREFAQTARRILETPGAVLRGLIDQVVAPEGFTHAQADQLWTGLMARKAIFLAGFSREVSSTLREEVLTAKQEYLRQYLARSQKEATGEKAVQKGPVGTLSSSSAPVTEKNPMKTPATAAAASAAVAAAAAAAMPAVSVAKEKQGTLPASQFQPNGAFIPSPFQGEAEREEALLPPAERQSRKDWQDFCMQQDCAMQKGEGKLNHSLATKDTTPKAAQAVYTSHLQKTQESGLALAKTLADLSLQEDKAQED